MVLPRYKGQAEGQGTLFSTKEHMSPMKVAGEDELVKGPAFRAGRFSALRIARALTTGDPIPGLPIRELAQQIGSQSKLNTLLQLIATGAVPSSPEVQQGACDLLCERDLNVTKAAIRIKELFICHRN